MISAMTFLILIAALTAVLAIATVRSALHDSRGTRRPPRSHHEDSRFLPPALG
jgi:hypothetical protein